MGIVTDVILPAALAFIMFSLGLGLTLDDFARVLKQPRDFVVGAVSQVVILPVVAFLLATLWRLPPEIALGVMIIAAAPGGVTSNILTSFAPSFVNVMIDVFSTPILFTLISSAYPFDGTKINETENNITVESKIPLFRDFFMFVILRLGVRMQAMSRTP